MKCPKCDSENNDSAKFCKKCGTPLKKKVINHENMINSMSNEQSNKDNTKIIIAVLVVVVVVLAGTFIYLYGSNFTGTNDADDSSSNSNSQQTVQQSSSNNDNSNDNDDSSSQSSEPVQATQSSSQAQSSKPTSISILGGSFSTGSAEEDLTYASINVGTQHAGEDVTVQIFYSRDGNSLNNGNMVPVTVHSDGYIEVQSADAYHYYPDYATINLFDSSGNLLDTKSVSLEPTSGTQTF